MTTCTPQWIRDSLRRHVLTFCLNLVMVIVQCAHGVYGFFIYVNCKQENECVRIRETSLLVLFFAVLQFGSGLLFLFQDKWKQNDIKYRKLQKIIAASIFLIAAWMTIINVLNWKNIYDLSKTWNVAVIMTFCLVAIYIVLALLLLMVIFIDILVYKTYEEVKTQEKDATEQYIQNI